LTHTLAPLVALAGALLVIAGAIKVVRPATARAALAAARFPARAPAVRALGIAEIAAGAALVVRPGPLTAAIVAFGYACFALFIVRLRRAHVECGCFGAAGGEASALHTVLNGFLAAACAVAALAPPPQPSWIAHAPPLTAAAYALGLAGAVYAAYLAFTLVPRAWSSYSPEAPR